MSDKTVIAIHETVAQSWLRTAGDVAALGFLPWFNYTYCGGSGWINAAIAVGWFVAVIAIGRRLAGANERTPAETRAWLDANFPEGPSS